MNFIANDILLYLLYQPWKDPNGSGQPQSRRSPEAPLPNFLGTTLNIGVIITAVVALVVYLLPRTGWGFGLRVVGGNPEAARRAGSGQAADGLLDGRRRRARRPRRHALPRRSSCSCCPASPPRSATPRSWPAGSGAPAHQGRARGLLFAPSPSAARAAARLRARRNVVDVLLALVVGAPGPATRRKATDERIRTGADQRRRRRHGDPVPGAGRAHRRTRRRGEPRDGGLHALRGAGRLRRRRRDRLGLGRRARRPGRRRSSGSSTPGWS